MAAKKRVDPIKQREKRAKIAAGIGCLLFLVVDENAEPEASSGRERHRCGQPQPGRVDSAPERRHELGPFQQR